MTSPAIEDGLSAAESALVQGRGLEDTGFWSCVSRVKRHPELAERYADRIAAIDRRAHREWALIVVPLWLGTLIMTVATLGGVALIWWAYYLAGLTQVIVFFIGTGVLLTTTHGLAHLVVGRLVGIHFTSWFIGRISQPQPGVKMDYSTYLRTPAARRAWMHASGAITTKAIPFLLLGAALAADLPGWAVVALLVLGVAMIATDVLWSTRSSDWMRFRREMEFAQDS